jgi:thiol-disulfide isomerase/thioredoxin
MLKKIFFLSFIFLFYLLFGAFITNSHRHWLPPTCVAGFILAYVLARQASGGTRFMQLFLWYYVPFLVLVLITSVVIQDFSRSLLYFFFLPLSAFLGYQFQRKRHYGYVLLFLIAAPFAGYILLPNTFSYIKGNATRKVMPFPELTFTDARHKALTFEKNKVVVLDFWTRDCGACFKKFPDFEAVYQKYQTNPDVVFYSVNVPLPKDSLPKTYNLVKKLNYAFPTIYASSLKEMEDKLAITGYPQIVILRNDTLYYKGNAYYEPYILINNIETEIKRVLR